MDITVFGNNYQGAYVAELKTLFERLLDMPRMHLSIERQYRDYLMSIIPEVASRIDVFANSSAAPDSALALSIGGDGTFLHTANRISELQTPIMGLNSGHLGYLSAVPVTQTDTIIDAIASGSYNVEPRTMLMATSDNRRLHPRPFALNEAAVLRQDTGSMIAVDTFINGKLLATYLGDGLIIATPTGSTAYNLSAGGPIIEPLASNWVITPIAPHSLNMRPLVVSDTAVIELVPRSRSNTFTLSLDGNTRAVVVGTRIKLSKAPFVTNVVVLPDHSFADTLRCKLLWGVNSL